MSRVFVIRDALGERPADSADFPLSVGGEGSAIRLAGQPSGSAFFLGLDESEVFAQVKPGIEVLHNGAAIRGSVWLNPGDILDIGGARLRMVDAPGERVLLVEDGAPGNITAPPIALVAAPNAGGLDDARIEAITFRAPGPRPRRRVTFSALRLAGYLAAMLVVAVIWFLFTATTVRVVSDPPAERVNFRGGLPAIPIAGRFVIRPGAYEVHIERTGYKPAEHRVLISAAPRQQLDFKLQKLPGRLLVQTPVAAQISIDDMSRGTAPGEFELAAGRHRVQLSVPRYQPFKGEVEVEGRGVRQRWSPSLVPMWSEVTITSDPAGAEVLIAGQSRGLTPLVTQLDAGLQSIELRRAGFKSWTSDVQVQANQPLTIGPVRLGLPDGHLAIRSEPAGAAVTLAGVYRGVTPLELELRPELEQHLVIAKAGFEPQERAVALQAGERRSIVVPLTGVFGEVTVKAQPADAQLFVDGEPHGSPNQLLKLTATAHEIEIRKPGLLSFKTTVTPRPGLQQLVTATLMNEEQARLASIPAVIRSTAGTELKLMPLGNFVMGSPRREAGRRANETQYPVALQRPFYFALRETTNVEYRKYKPEHRSGFVGANTLDLDRQPVVGISWEDAAAYCNWLSQQEKLPPAYVSKNGTFVLAMPVTTGYRLPTEAEWEWVARFDRPGKLRRYPWGDDLPVPVNSGNFADQSARTFVQETIPDYDDSYAATAPVGSFPANPLGVFDVAGNAAEWVNDYYATKFETQQPEIDPAGPAEGKQRVIRGSSWRSFSVTDLRLTARDYGDASRNDLGFRIARYAQ